MTARRRDEADEQGGVWRALAHPVRREIVEALASGPRTTGDLAAAFDGLSRFAVMQHLGVLDDAGLLIVRRRGRYRVNHLDPVPLRRWYEQWVPPMADAAGAEMLALERHLHQEGEAPMSTDEPTRTVRIETELRFTAAPDRVFRALTQETLAWFPHSYGGDRTIAVVMEPFVGGRHYEDWGDGAGHLYGHVTSWDPPHAFALRGRVMPGTILDTEYRIEADDEVTTVQMSKVATGPMTEDEAASITTYGDLARFEDAIRTIVE